jgi:hypothetical protein
VFVVLVDPLLVKREEAFVCVDETAKMNSSTTKSPIENTQTRSKNTHRDRVRGLPRTL